MKSVPYLAPGDEAVLGKQREAVRDSLFLQATLHAENGGIFIARVRNLSAGGMMVEGPVEAEPGDRLHVELRGIGRIAARVAWARGGRMGFAFDESIDPKAARKPVSGGGKPATR